MLVDAAFLNFIVSDLKRYFENVLNRPLQEIDLSLLTTYLALDAGIEEGDNKVQLLFVYDQDSSNLVFCNPSDLKKELDGVAFSDQFGEFSFAGVPCVGMVTREELFLDLLQIVLDSADVKKLIVLSFNEEYDNKVQLLFVYDQDSSNLVFCNPSDLKKELDGVAFSDQFGEFSFAGVPCVGMVTREELFLDLLQIVLDSADVKKLIVLSFNEEYGNKVTAVLNKVKEKEIIQFRVDESEETIEYQWEMLAYPLMQALGIKGDEL